MAITPQDTRPTAENDGPVVPNPAVADSGAVGQVAKVTGEVLVIHADGSAEILAAGDLLLPGDIIQTGADGAVGFALADGSNVSMADGSRMVLDEVIFDPATGEGSVVLSAMEGTFAVEGGQIAANDPKSMTVETPFGAITVGAGQVGIAVGEGLDIVAMTTDSGTFGDILFRNDGGFVTLDQPNAFVHIDSVGSVPGPVGLADIAAIDATYRSALDHLPAADFAVASFSGALPTDIRNLVDFETAAGPADGCYGARPDSCQGGFTGNGQRHCWYRRQQFDPRN